jgi:hypothetical protein
MARPNQFGRGSGHERNATLLWLDLRRYADPHFLSPSDVASSEPENRVSS